MLRLARHGRTEAGRQTILLRPVVSAGVRPPPHRARRRLQQRTATSGSLPIVSADCQGACGKGISSVVFHTSSGSSIGKKTMSETVRRSQHGHKGIISATKRWSSFFQHRPVTLVLQVWIFFLPTTGYGWVQLEPATVPCLPFITDLATNTLCFTIQSPPPTPHTPARPPHTPPSPPPPDPRNNKNKTNEKKNAFRELSETILKRCCCFAPFSLNHNRSSFSQPLCQRVCVLYVNTNVYLHCTGCVGHPRSQRGAQCDDVQITQGDGFSRSESGPQSGRHRPVTVGQSGRHRPVTLGHSQAATGL